MTKEEFVYWITGIIIGNTVLLGTVIKVSLYAFKKSVEDIAQREVGYLRSEIRINEQKIENKFEEIKNQFQAHVIEDVKSFFELKSQMQTIANEIEKLRNAA